MYRQNQSASRDSHNVRPPRAPERPLAPYMRFSRKMWPKIRQENPDNLIWDIGKTIKQMWQDTPESEKYVYQQEFEQERVEYEKVLRAYYNSASYQQYLTARTRVKPNEKTANASGGGRKGANADSSNTLTGVIIQPVDDEEPFELTGKRLSAVRYDRNNRLMSELFSPSYLPDARTMVPQQRIDQLKKQGNTLAIHQAKLNDELNRLEESFNNRKSTIESSSKNFEEELKKVCEDRPQPSEERYNSLVLEWQGVLLRSYDDYKKRQAAIRARLEAERRETPVLYSLTCEKSPSPDRSQPTNGNSATIAAISNANSTQDEIVQNSTTAATAPENYTVAAIVSHHENGTMGEAMDTAENSSDNDGGRRSDSRSA